MMTQPESDLSRQVESNQSGLHPRLAETVARHLIHDFRRPAAAHAAPAYAQLTRSLRTHPRPLILDSFCGTGQSTALLAQNYPGHLVAGIDQSAHRLERHVASERDNYLLLHACVEDIWQLLLRDGVELAGHYLLYPNPWPKAKHLQRRVHGHASFSWLLQLGGYIELRSNWQLYVEEFGTAMHLAGQRGHISRVSGDQPLTLFEKKYQDSGHQLWRFTAGRAVTNTGL